MADMTVRIFNKSFDETEKLLIDAGLDHVVHGTRDDTAIFVSGCGDVLSDVRNIGIDAEKCR